MTLRRTGSLAIPSRCAACSTTARERASLRGHAKVAAEIGGDGLDVCVLDRGPGIAPDDVDRLFEPFERGEDSRNRDTGGSGLGLGIARELMRAIGGDVVLQQRDGGGLDARVRFPIAIRVD